MRSNRKLSMTSAIATGMTLAFAVSAPLAIAASGEFGGQCTMGLALGKVVDTPCEVTWKSEAGKTYCFGNAEAKDAFLKDPKQNLAKAEAYYQSNAK